MKYIELIEAHEEYNSKPNAALGITNFNDYQKRKSWNFVDLDEESVEADVLGFVNIWGLCRIPYDRKTELFRALKNVKAYISYFKEKRLWEDFDFHDEKQRSVIINIFSELDKIDRVSGVAISKMLHMFCPDFFVMWENAIMRSYGFCNNVEGYLNFLQRIKSEIVENNLLKDYIDSNLRKEVNLLKLIDEFNMMKMRQK